jgi:ATP-dependent 26S proteasome regulatory subunit
VYHPFPAVDALLLPQVLMATNRIDILDPALLRPGRIDRKIEFPNPNDNSRLDILKIHSRKMNLTRGINLKKIAELMQGSSGAELKGCCTEAGVDLKTVHLCCKVIHSPVEISCGWLQL